MLRTVIQIDEERCDGCGLCVSACHEGAIGLVDGKAKLLRDDYCDGMGDCLPACPAGAISFIEREAAPYDEAAVEAHLRARATGCAGACPSAIPVSLTPAPSPATPAATGASARPEPPASQLRNWPVQIKLAPVMAPYFAGCDLLIAADCTAFACASLHADLMAGRVTLIGCPKLDGVDYAEKLAAIVSANDIRSVTVACMQVPCCGGIEQAARRAVAAAGGFIPLEVVTFAADGSRV